jgi:hypothetical protein
VTVFLEGLENRGDNNLRKRIYFAGVTPDLYAPKYQGKVERGNVYKALKAAGSLRRVRCDWRTHDLEPYETHWHARVTGLLYPKPDIGPGRLGHL